MLKIRKNKIVDVVFSFIFLFFLLERIYMPITITSGTYNSYISVILGTVSMICLLVKRNGQVNVRIMLLMGLFTFYVVITTIFLAADATEAARYLFDVFLMITGYEMHLGTLGLIVYVQFLFGVFYSFFKANYFNGRITGFLTTSPTNFSLLLVIGIAYVLFVKRMNIFTILVLGVSLVMIYLTYSRSILLIAIFLIMIKVYRIFINLDIHRLYKVIGTLILSIILIIIMFYVIPKINTIRSDGADSTTTRVYLLTKLFQSLLNSPSTVVFGHGAGASYLFIQTLLGIKLPPHFDALVWIYDLGIVGTTLVIYLFTKVVSKRYMIVSLIILAVGTLYNFLFFPVGLMFLFLFWGNRDAD